jgi:hypothetical protein
MKLGHIVDAGAASRMPDQIAAIIRCYPFDSFGLGQPDKRIVEGEGLTENSGKDATKPRQNLRMSGSRCPSANNLSNRRQVQADHAILENTHPVFVK